MTTNDIAGNRAGPMQNPPRLGEPVRESIDNAGWSLTRTATHPRCEHGSLERLPNGRAVVPGDHCIGECRANRMIEPRTHADGRALFQ
ncbi:MAG: hypothetical protein OXC66_08915 [Roseovarius sp.]|nr:hypothetical protein [Roseovarius sp.]